MPEIPEIGNLNSCLIRQVLFLSKSPLSASGKNGVGPPDFAKKLDILFKFKS